MSMYSRAVVALGEAAHINAADDDSVPEGLYWRVTPSGAADLPAGPVLLRHLRVDPEPVRVVDASTGQQPKAGRRVTPDAAVLLLPRTPPGAMICWAYIQGKGNLRVAAISARAAVGGAYVELSARTQEPYAIAGHDMAGLVISGDGRIIESAFYALPANFVGDIGDIAGPPQVHALPDNVIPVRGYAAQGNAASWQERVALAAPRRSVPYALTDPGGDWSPDDELRRAEQIARTGGSVADWVSKAYDPLGSGSRGIIQGATGGAGQPYRVVATQTAAAALGIAALDPGIARWLGRSGMLTHRLVDAEPYGLLVATVPLHVYPSHLPSGVSVARNPSDDAIYDDRIGANGAYLDLLQEVHAWQPHPEFGPPDVLLAHIPLPYFPGITPARPIRPTVGAAPQSAGIPGGSGPRWAPDTPRRWEQSITVGDRPTSAYALHGPIARGPVALRRTTPSEGSLHPEIDNTGLAAPLVPGWDDATGVLTLSGSQGVPDGAQAVPVTWSVTLSDWVGRWGDAAATSPLTPPAPPPPAPPTIEAGLDRHVASAGSAAASPGQVDVLFRVPPNTVPGALSLQRITWTVDGAAQPALNLTGVTADPDAASLLVRAQFPAPPTTPGQRQPITITAHVEDSADTPSDTTTFELDASDSRPLRPPTVAAHLLATSRRSGDPNVSVTLTVRASGPGAYRFYLASESALRIAGSIETPPAATRAARAQQLNEHASIDARRASILVLPEPVPVKGGWASARLDIPAGTVDVLAVRAVPVTAQVDGSGRVIRDGVEPPFTSVKPVFVVVPFDEVPPTPELSLTPVAGEAGATSAAVTAKITVRGVQAAVLNHYAHEPIRARIVEASTDGDPWFWPHIASAPLTQSPTDPTLFTAALIVHVPVWSRAGLAVAVQYPPEDMVVPGVDMIDEPELSAAGPQGTRIESPWGPVSVPAWVEVSGPEPAIATTSDETGGLRIHVSDLPNLAVGAATFRLDLYGSPNGRDGALLELSSQTVTASSPEVIISADIVTAHQRLIALIVTPFGRSLTPVDVVP